MERVFQSAIKRNKNIWKNVCLQRSSKDELRKQTHFRQNQPSIIRICCRHFTSPNNSTKIQDLKHVKFLRRELRAFGGLLQRSGLKTETDVSRLLTGGQRCFSTSQICYDDEKDKDGKDKKDPEQIPRVSQLFAWIWLFVCIYLVANFFKPDEMHISWNEFHNDMLSKGEVDEIVVVPLLQTAMIHLCEGAIIKGIKTDQNVYKLKIQDAYDFEKKVRRAEEKLGIKNGVPISFQREGEGPGSLGQSLLALYVIGMAVFFLRRGIGKGGMQQMRNPMDMFANARKAKFLRVDLMSQQGKGITFKEIAGLKEAKVEIIEFVDYLKNPQRFKELGGKIPHGALLLGPPGCGKTLLAKAVATEAKVPFLAMAGSEFVEMLGGLGAARVRDLFKEARKRSPCIVYVDEIDAIGRKRGGRSLDSEEEHTLNQLLVEMDGMGTQEGVIMLASTNRADVLDKALLRPGRFDRHITIDLPTLIERRETFEMYLKKLKVKQDASVYSPRLAQLTPGMSGADIANICNEAALFAAREQKKCVDTADLEYAVERVLAGVAKKTHLLSPTEKKVVAYHESGHALVGWMLKHTDALLRISIVPRTNSALGFAQYLPSDQKLYSSDELFERMCMALGGRAAEAIIFNSVTSGAQDDLKKVTDLAYNQIRTYGMNDNIGLLSFPSPGEGAAFSQKPYSKKLSALIDEEARSLVSRAYRHTEKVLQENKDKLQVLATTLLEKEILSHEDIEVLIGPPPHGKKHLLEPHGWEGIMPDDTTPEGNNKKDNDENDNY